MTALPALHSELRTALAHDPQIPPAALIEILHRHGLISRFVEPLAEGGYRYRGEWREVLACLAGIGGIDLSMARLLEGHLNTLQLVSLYGSREQQERVLATIRAGGMLGVWGADGEPPARLNPAGERAWVMGGAKRYASGVGTLCEALVPVTLEDGAMQLLLLRVDDPARADASSWNHRGMRRTVSGTYDFEGVAVGGGDLVGARDDYRREPFFVGGIWRCAAAQLGAIEAIVAHMARELNASGRDDHPLQMARIGTAILKARTARLWIEDAAGRIETCPPDAAEAQIARRVALSAYARLATEEAAMAVIDLAERALGLGSFAASHPVEALTRDLAVYIRQANPDAVLLQHGRVLAAELRR